MGTQALQCRNCQKWYAPSSLYTLTHTATVSLSSLVTLALTLHV